MLAVPKASVHGGDSKLLLLKGELSSPSHRKEGISWRALRNNPQDPAAIARDAWRFEADPVTPSLTYSTLICA